MLIAGNGRSAEQLYVEDIFSTYLYTGNGSTQTINNGINLVGKQTAAALDVKTKFSTTLYTGNGLTGQTITNGINLAGQGGLVWTKNRGITANHILIDSARGIGNFLRSNTDGAQGTDAAAITSFNSTGYSINSSTVNDSNNTYVSWTFRKAPKLFDIVTYTGDDNFSGRQIAHNLGIAPGCIIVKKTSGAKDWEVWHRSLTDGAYLQLNSQTAQVAAGGFDYFGAASTQTSTYFTLGDLNDDGVNRLGQTYVAYLFAHDTAADSLIQCGSFTTNGSGAATVTLGWRPQWCMVKCSTMASSDWQIRDTTRGWGPGNDARLFANTSGAETSSDQGEPTATGFTVSGMELSQTYIYVAIRTDQEYDGSSGGLVWLKSRNAGADNHALFDTARGVGNRLVSNLISAQDAIGGALTSFNSNGFSINNTSNVTNVSPYNYASWTFRKQPKFFDVVTYTGTGVAGLTINHNLGSAPGVIIVKNISGGGGNWAVYHRSLGASAAIFLDLTNASSSTTGFWNGVTPTSTQFTVGTSGAVNTNGATHVAYLFAHDAGGFGASGSDNVITCGSFTTDGSGNATVTLGYEPQWLLRKDATNAGTDWHLYDSMRGLTVAGQADAILYPNSSAAEGSGSQIGLTATGFTIAGFAVSSTYIYIAIRRGPMKTPTTGTSVYNGIARTGTGATATVTGVGFAPDLFLPGSRQALALGGTQWFDRLRGTPALKSSGTAAEYTTGADGFLGYTMDGVSLGTDASNNELNFSSRTYINWFFRRAPGFFDVVCYTGDGVGTGKVISHNLSVVPELIITKTRNGTTDWRVWSSLFSNQTSTIRLNLSDSTFTNSWFNQLLTHGSGVGMTATQYSTATGNSEVNGNGNTYVAYLFATCPGVSKVGTYTGNGGALNSNPAPYGAQYIDCGFTTGARFILIKRTDATDNWYVYDSARGIVNGTDPRLLLNANTAEFSADEVDPSGSGFAVNQTSVANLNVDGATYIYLAIA